ncbi:MAG: ABC transporter ATP-binding protein [Thermodesulfobacteriota bacterium]
MWATLEVNELTKYFGGLAAVNGLDFTVGRGEMVGLIGPNGAGKTTVFNLITGFLPPTKGKIVFKGKEVTHKKPHAIARTGIVRTFQTTTLFPGFSVLNNIIAGCYLKSQAGFWGAVLHSASSRRKEQDVLARAMKILHFVGLSAVKDQPARRLPHGHRRILGIAVAMAADPQLLLLDEPLSGMNADEVGRAVSLITRIREEGTTILLIEHNMRAAMNLCQRIIVLEMGRKIAEGRPEEVRANEEVIKAYLGTGKHAA